ncbi:MAG TPA: hypothetical protein VGA09_09130 [Candidatus Binatia bacterium]
MDKELKDGIDRAKKNLDNLAKALDRVATDPRIREKLGKQPIQALTQLGFELDAQDRAEIRKDLAAARKAGLAFPKFKALVKSGVKSGVKVGVETAASTAVKSVIKETAEGVAGPAKKPKGKRSKK